MMGPTRSWTGRDATILRKALRMTTDGFAARLQVAPRTVANWAANPEMVPRLGAQDELDRLLATAPADVQAHLDDAEPSTGSEAAQVLRVAIAVLTHDGQVLLVRRRDDGAGISWQILDAGTQQTIAANIAAKFPDSSGLAVNVLIATGLALFVITMVVNMLARWIVSRRSEFSGAN